MESVINKLRNTVSTVTSTVSQLSVVLPGNPVTREYEFTNHIASGGPGLLWKIYSGYKKSTRQEGSIFLFEKKQLDKWSRRDRERMIEVLKKGVQQLTKLRHPRILTVQHPLEESRDSLAFATEPILGSLANILGNHKNTPQPLTSSLKEYSLDEIDIKFGLLHVAEGLQFLHKDANLVHGNLCPESIILSEHGSWKIAGFDFANQSVSEGHWPKIDLDEQVNPDSYPNLDFLAPEVFSKVSPLSDMFSLGILTYASFNHGQPVFESGGNLQTFKHNSSKLNSLSEAKLKGVPQEIRSFVRSLLNSKPESRPDAHHFSKLSFLNDDEGVKTLHYLDTLFQWDNLQKSKFFKGLPPLLEKLPHRVRLHRVMPCLAGELVNSPMVPFVLPNILKIGDWSTKDEFQRHVLPPLREAMKIREPIQVLFIFLKNMDLLLEKTNPDVQKSDLIPLLYSALDSGSEQVHEIALGIIPALMKHFDHASTKNQLLPRLRKLTLQTQTLSVRVSSLVCLGKILEDVEKWLVLDFVLPFLTEIPSREPSVIMAIIGILKVAATHRKLGLPKDIVANRILPFLFPLTIENLGIGQLDALLGFIQQLISQVAKEQKTKIQALQSHEMTSEMESIRGMEGIFNENLPNGHTQTPMSSNPLTPDTSYVPTEKKSQSVPVTPQQHKDLTSTLIQSQLNLLKISPSPSTRFSSTNQAQTGSLFQTSTFQSPPLPNYTPLQNSSFQKQIPMNFTQQQNIQQMNFTRLNSPKDQNTKALSAREIDELLK